MFGAKMPVFEAGPASLTIQQLGNQSISSCRSRNVNRHACGVVLPLTIEHDKDFAGSTFFSCPLTAGNDARVGHADASADAHRMRINAHRCASSAYWAKNEIPFFTYKLPFWLR